MTAASQRQGVGERGHVGLRGELDEATGAGGQREQRVEEQQHLVRARARPAGSASSSVVHSVAIIRREITATATAATPTTPSDQRPRSSCTERSASGITQTEASR